MSSQRILLIDDDNELSQLVSDYLTLDGFSLDVAADGVSGLERAQSGLYQLILLDVMLPGLDGLSLLRQLRQSSYCPVLMLTARGDDIDRIVGLELGADDYLAKPFNPRELSARVRAILRRVELAQQQSNSQVATPILEINQVQLNRQNRQVWCNGQQIVLTATEFQLLDYLMHHAGQVITKEDLSKAVLGRALQQYDRSLDMHISNIRKKLAVGDSTEKIQTLRGSGYLFLEQA
ncbi:MAG: response regulator transcription factor [Gammaproteobacteria bacterium]|nr:response regulator transcription factor [Gammaproteobacteria bacterium]MBU2180814.1 response regulator transcription factor [Gammaproteobacteria bacterium]MBU2278891.1 response regulator transcription factor [Gammaproteobacteria bacterium]MBU2426888.1 response regulator transcription factor [Gammaproteobacteria bacterium]